MSMDAAVRQAHAIAFPRALLGEPWAGALAKAPVVRHADGALVCDRRVAACCGDLSIVLSGALCIRSMACDGRALKIYRVHPGEACVLSLAAAHGAVLPHIEVRAEGETLLSRLSGDAFAELLREPAFQQFLLKSMAATVGTLIERVEEASFESLRDRVLRRVTELGGSGDAACAVRLSHQELAEELGSTREAVSRVLKELEKLGLVSLGRRTIELRARRHGT